MKGEREKEITNEDVDYYRPLCFAGLTSSSSSSFFAMPKEARSFFDVLCPSSSYIFLWSEFYARARDI